MTNNLLNLKKNLKSFAKRCKDFKYTDSALLTFLLSGMLISTGQVFAETVTNSQINNQVSQINTSINQMRTDFKRARAENNKLIRDTNLELTQ
uniref:autotransporter-associated N-terminal domain-containing protein n=1 Tax=uncultured Leptotrichia sp. TaxID=159271 RepID=UPI002612FBCA